MRLLEAAALGLLQGVTEFLPVSSSGHLTLAERAFGMELDKDAVTLDVALHAATLLALLVYFGRDWLRRIGREPRLALLALLAGVPAGAVYLAAGGLIVRAKGSLWAVGAAFLAAGAFLAFASLRSGSPARATEPAAADSSLFPSRRQGLVSGIAVGGAQAVALLPGVSRSGVTIAAGLMGGLRREAAFEFSFMAGAPLMLGAVVVKFRDLGQAAAASGAALATGAAIAFASGLVALAVLRRVVARGRIWGFGIYTAVVGVGCFVWAIGGTA